MRPETERLPAAGGYIVLSQAAAQAAGHPASFSACTITIEPSGQAHPHSTGGGGAGLPRPANTDDAPIKMAQTDKAAANRVIVFMVMLVLLLGLDPEVGAFYPGEEREVKATRALLPFCVIASRAARRAGEADVA